jgi:hypothetical protein
MNRKGLQSLIFCAVLLAFFSSVCLGAAFAAAQPEEETIAGMVVKTDKGIIIEADDGDYLVKGAKTQEIGKMVGKLIEVTGIITESDKGDTIEAKSFEEIQE